ncbi:tyrosine-type recombinase/integrase [Aeromicrobium wangtongii]|uniref:tyrosine-type recombinase/integrase n=1 Tax=Aeromicrobium wangtongii TaxID=2969247 RepID=UPI002017397D|nr:tyrosine-type recombinase/integrase [Aeromicrobium wangtongii]MCL3818544.1 tyrosine-type recombinase/integrase [Aeromicrobium wangtongii]
MTTDLTTADLSLLLGSWELSLRAERKSPQTLKSYGDGVRAYLKWAAAQDLDANLSRPQVRSFVDTMLTGGAAPATARSRQLAVRRFSAWLAEEGEISIDPLVGMKPPKIDQPVVEPLTTIELKALIKACAGPDMRDKRDEAIIRLMLETGARAGETAAIAIGDVDLTNGVVIIRKGKGGKGRSVPIGPEIAKAIDRYIRARRTHRLADSPDLWLGDRGKSFGYDALHKTLTMRAVKAGVVGFHPHKLRHTAAHRWLEAGGSEGGLMAMAGWTRPDMLMRYTKAQASNRAAAESKRLNLGEL